MRCLLAYFVQTRYHLILCLKLIFFLSIETKFHAVHSFLQLVDNNIPKLVHYQCGWSVVDVRLDAFSSFSHHFCVYFPFFPTFSHFDPMGSTSSYICGVISFDCGRIHLVLIASSKFWTIFFRIKCFLMKNMMIFSPTSSMLTTNNTYLKCNFCSCHSTVWSWSG